MAPGEAPRRPKEEGGHQPRPAPRREGAAGHRPPPAGAGEAPRSGAAGRSRDEGTKRCRPAGSAVPARRGRVTESLCVPADPPAGGRDQSASVSLSLTARGLPPPRRALTQSGTDTDTRFARDAAGLPPPHTPTATPAWAGAARAGR